MKSDEELFGFEITHIFEVYDKQNGRGFSFPCKLLREQDGVATIKIPWTYCHVLSREQFDWGYGRDLVTRVNPNALHPIDEPRPRLDPKRLP